MVDPDSEDSEEEEIEVERYLVEEDDELDAYLEWFTYTVDNYDKLN